MSNSDYNYDAEGQFFPFFMLTIVGLVTIPLTYNVLKPSSELEQTAAKVQSDFKSKDDDLIQAQKRRQKRKDRKTKRIIAVALGWASMCYLGYLVYNSEQTRVKLWDPYDILGVSRVRSPPLRVTRQLTIHRVLPINKSTPFTGNWVSNTTRTKPNQILLRMRQSNSSTIDGWK